MSKTMLFAKAPELETLNSRLLPDLFDLKMLEGETTIRVLDLGGANCYTFNFLSQFNCRLQVVDIKENLVGLGARLKEDPDLKASEIKDHLREAFSFAGDERFDICLIWDFLNYLNAFTLPVFADVLLPRLSPRAKLHGFAVLNKSTPLTEQNYGVVDTELFSVTGQTETELPYRHSQSAIKDAMRGLTVKQSILRADGRLEILLNPDL